MHARVGFFRVAEGGNAVAAVKGFDDFIPTVQQMDGNKGVLLLIDRSKGKVVTITLWDSEGSLYSTREKTDALRQQTAADSGLLIQGVEHFEVVRDEKRRGGTLRPFESAAEGEGASLYARVSFYRSAEGRDIDAAVESFDKAIRTVREMAGNQGLKLMIDRHKGKVMAITLWESPDALRLSSQLSNSVPQQAASAGGLTIQGVEHYEVVRDER